MGGEFDACISATDFLPREGYAEDILVSRFVSTSELFEPMQGRLAFGASILTISSRTGWRWRLHYDQVQELLKLSSAAELRHFIKLNSIDEARAYALASQGFIAFTNLKTEDFVGRRIHANSINPRQ